MWDYPCITHVPAETRNLPTSFYRLMLIRNEVANLASIISSLPRDHQDMPMLVRRLRWLVWAMQMQEQQL